MPRPLLVFSKSDYLIPLVDANSNTEWQTADPDPDLFAKAGHIRVQQDKGKSTIRRFAAVTQHEGK